MSLTDAINIVVSLISIVIALFALYQTKQQIALSNKQQLFDRRLSSYTKFITIYSLYSENKEALNKENAFLYLNEFEYSFLINCSDLEQMIQAISKPLQQNEQKIFLKKIEELNNLALEISMIFDAKSSEMLSNFVSSYTELLRKLYKQRIVVGKLRDRKQENGITIEQKDYEEKSKQNLKDINIQETLNELNRLDKEITDKNILEDTKNSLRLTKVKK